MIASAQFTLAVDMSWLRDGGIARMAREVLARKPDGVRIVQMRADRSNAGVLTPIDLALRSRSVRADAVWSPGFIPPAARFSAKPTFITIHDLAHRHRYSGLHRAYYDLVIRRLLKNVETILTVSDFTRREILNWSGIDERRVVRIYNGVSETFRADGDQTRSVDYPYVIYVGNRRSYKNINRLIAGFAQSSLAGEGYWLWLSGDWDEQLALLAAKHGIAHRLHCTGELSDDALADAMRGARALAFVSLYEGFGLPVVEAMACGCPVLTSNTTALAEVADTAALTVDPESVEAIAAGLRRICHDEPLRATLRAAGLRRAAAFSWDRAAAEYWRVLTSG